MSIKQLVKDDKIRWIFLGKGKTKVKTLLIDSSDGVGFNPKYAAVDGSGWYMARLKDLSDLPDIPTYIKPPKEPVKPVVKNIYEKLSDAANLRPSRRADIHTRMEIIGQEYDWPKRRQALFDLLDEINSWEVDK